MLNGKKLRWISLIVLLFVSVVGVILPVSFGMEWSPDMRLTWDDEWDHAPSAVHTKDGKIWLFWHSYRTGDAEIFYKIYDPSQVHEWSPEMQLTNHTDEDGTPYAMQADDGSIWVVWMSNREGNFEIFYKIYNGTQWSNDMRLTYNASVDELPSIMQTSDGKIWVFWSSTRTGNYDIFYKTSVDYGKNWSPPQQLTTHRLEEWDPAPLETSSGEIWVAFTRKDDIFYMIYDGVEWSSPIQLTTDTKDDWHPSIFQDAAGNIWVFWDSNRIAYNEVYQTDIFYNVYTDGSWLSKDVQLTTHHNQDDMPSALQDINKTIWVFWGSNRMYNRDIYYRINSTLPPHDVEIFSVKPLNASIKWGEDTEIEVVARNRGENNETIEVKCYINETLLDTKVVWDLPPGQLEVLYFNFNSVDYSWGNYTLSAVATPVLDETNIDDNTYVDGVLIVRWYDLAVLDVVPSKTVVGQGYNMFVNVTVINRSTQKETFNVTAYYNGTVIGVQEVTLGSGKNVSLIFTWNTSGVEKGNYTIHAFASPLEDEGNILDNTYVDGEIIVTTPGDVNGDGTVDNLDLAAIVQTFGFTPEMPEWNANYDINHDYVVDLFDLWIFARHYGVTDP